MKISGLQKLTLLDYPGHLAAIVFLPGCNFRCPFCQNSSLVLAPEEAPEISPDEFSRFLKKRSGILEGICVTGGEPTLYADLPDLLKMIRAAGYLVKLDTNGSNPIMLESLLNEGILDYAAMDIKAGRENYYRVCGLKTPGAAHFARQNSPADLTGFSAIPNRLSADPSSFPADTTMLPADPLLTRINRSVELLKNSSIKYEFRTTVVKGLHTESDFTDIADWLAGNSSYYLQSFRDCPEVLQQDHTFSDFSKEEMEHFLEIVQKKIPAAKLRGIE